MSTPPDNLDNLVHFQLKKNERKREELANYAPRSSQESATDERFLKLLETLEDQQVQIYQLKGMLKAFIHLYKKHRKITKGPAKTLVMNKSTSSITTED